jgi:hypothetical protein
MQRASRHHPEPGDTGGRGSKAALQPALALAVPMALLNAATVRALTGLSASGLARQLRDSQRPFPAAAVRFNRSPRWRAADVLAWLDAVAGRTGIGGTLGHP